MYGQAAVEGHHSNPTGWKRWATQQTIKILEQCI